LAGHLEANLLPNGVLQPFYRVHELVYPVHDLGQTAQLQGVLTEHGGEVASVAFRPDGKLLASGAINSTVKLWDIAHRKEVHNLQGHTSWVERVVFSPDGRLLATASTDQTVRLWNVAAGKPVPPVLNCPGQAWSVAFSPDSKLVAAGCVDGSITIWNLASRWRLSLPAGPRIVHSLAFHPNGRTLLSGGPDNTIRLWELATLREKERLLGQQVAGNSCAWRADGQLLASADCRDGTVRGA